MEGDVTTCFIILYIPLCFYYIDYLYAKDKNKLNFTFHYASTISRLSIAVGLHRTTLHSTMLLLYHFHVCFHSAMLYLYIPLCFYYILLPAGVVYTTYVTLHSTMLLLYLDSYCRFRLPSVLYIPLCFYYISTLPPAVTNNATFTFHYASTISVVAFNGFSQGVPLHSTMLLLYLWSTVISSMIAILYIPLCFYYILAHAVGFAVPPFFTFHYASTISVTPHFEQASLTILYIPLCFYYIR